MTPIESASPNLPFDRGIDSVAFANGQGPMNLPERTSSPPPEIASRPELEMLLEKQSLNGWMADAIRPHIVHRDLLMPSRFQQVLEGVHSMLKEAAAQRSHVGAATQEAVPALRTLNRAARLLGDEVSLRALASSYRSALYQG